MTDDVDMTPFIEAKSNQLNADDLFAGPKTVTITNVSAVSGDQPIRIDYAGGEKKPYYPCKSMIRVLTHLWSKKGKSWIGKSMTLYRDPKVKWAGVEVGGIRISHMSDIKGKQTMALTERRGAKAAYVVEPLKVEAVAPKESSLVPEGDAAAKGGVESYKKWIAGLSADQKKDVAHKHPEWSAIAKEVGE